MRPALSIPLAAVSLAPTPSSINQSGDITGFYTDATCGSDAQLKASAGLLRGGSGDIYSGQCSARKSATWSRRLARLKATYGWQNRTTAF
jgi:hypothetical protein